MINSTVINKTRTHYLSYSDDIGEVANLTATHDIIPLISLSCVTGSGLTLLKDLFFTLKPTSVPSNFSTLKANQSQEITITEKINDL